MPATHPHKIFAAPIGAATPNTIYTQQGSKPACQQYVHPKFSQLLLAQLPRTTFTHSKAPNPHASRTSTQNFHSSYWRSFPDHNLHTATSPTPATQKQRKSGGAQNAPKRTSDPGQALQVPRLPRKSSGRAAETKTRQSVHQTPLKCRKSHTCHAKRSGRAAETKTRQSVHQTPCKRSKSHACHAKAAEERRRPKRAKAYIRPLASAPSPTPATQKQRQSGGDQNAPKRTSDPLEVPQVPHLPRKSSGRAAETKTRQSVHQTPCKCSKSHACHAKAAEERRRPKRAKAYIRPRASAPSPTPATQKQRQSQAVWCQPAWCQSVWRQAVWCQAVWHQSVWCQSVRCQSVWCQSVWRQVSSCVMSSCVMSSCVMSTYVMSSCVMSSCVMSTCVMCVILCVCVVLCVDVCTDVCTEVDTEEGGAEGGGGGGRCQPKNKNPTRQCGEKYRKNRKNGASTTSHFFCFCWFSWIFMFQQHQQ